MTNKENVTVIKWHKEETELMELFQGYGKKDLLSLAETQTAALRKSWNKTKMASVLAERITELAETIYHEVLEEVLLRLPDLETHSYRINAVSDIEGFKPLIQKGFFFVGEDKDGLLLIIPEEVLFSVKDRLTSEQGTGATEVSGDSRKVQILNSWRDKAVSIYGGVSLEHLKNTWNRYFDEQVTVEEIERLLH